MSAENHRTVRWNKVTNRKSQKQIDEEINALFGAKVIGWYEEDNKIIQVCEPR